MNRNLFQVLLRIIHSSHFVGMAFLFLISFPFNADSAEESSSRLNIFVSILPQVDFVQRIAGDRVQVDALIPPGRETHTFEPTPKQVTALSQARIFFQIGIPFESMLLDRIGSNHPNLTIVDTIAGIKRHDIIDDHDHAQAAEVGSSPDVHVWLSPPLIKIQAENIASALKRIDPSHAKEYQDNLQRFVKEIDRVDQRIRVILAPFKGRAFFVFHPSFGYFAETYGLVQEAVETGGKEPTPRELSLLIQKAREDKVKVIFVQPQFDKRACEAIAAAIGGVALPMDAMSQNVLQNLESAAQSIAKALHE